MRAARLVACAAPGLLSLAACVNFGSPLGLPKGTYAERLETFARLLRMEDERLYDPLLVGRAVASPDPWLRAKTALAAGRLRTPEASPYLPVLLRDDDPVVRRAAAFGTGLGGDRRLVRFLAAALEDPDPETASEAALALGRLGGPEAAHALVSVLEGRPRDGAAAARALFGSGEPEAVRALLPLSDDVGVPAGVRRAAVYALARQPRPEALPAVEAVLRRDEGDEDPEALAWAARAAGLLGDERAIPDLVRLAASGNVSVAVQSLQALNQPALRPPSGIAAARSVALTRAGDPLPGVAVAALRVLGRFVSDPGVAGRLEEAVRNGGWRGQAALASLAAVDADRALPLAEAAVSSAAVGMRLGAVEALASLPPKRTEALRRRLLRDVSPRVRAAAVEALAAGPGGPEVLLSALGDRDPAVRAVAVEAAARRRDGGDFAKALEAAWEGALEGLLHEREPDLKVTAVEAAGAHARGGKERLEALAGSPDAIVRACARRLLLEKFGASADSFPPVPVGTRFSLDGYRRIARWVNESLLQARVVTPRGEFTITLDAEAAPLTVWNFVDLAHRGFFDRGSFHRVVPDFVVQGGDPRGDGTGGPGYAIRDELGPAPFRRGTLGMALSGPDTAGSQWFVTLSAQPHLDGRFTAFGSVTDGLKVLDHLEQDDAILSVAISVTRRAAPPPGAQQ